MVQENISQETYSSWLSLLKGQRNVQGCFLAIVLSRTQCNRGRLLPMHVLAWRNGAMRSEGSRQQALLTLRGKHTPTPRVCGDKA